MWANGSSLLNENFAALRSSGGPDGPGENSDDGENPIKRGFTTGTKYFPIPGEADGIEVPCCVPSIPTNLCDYGQLGCISNDVPFICILIINNYLIIKLMKRLLIFLFFHYQLQAERE